MNFDKPSSIYQGGIGAIVVLAVLAYMFVISPQLDARAEAKESAESTLAAVEVAQGRLASLRNKVDEGQDSIDELNDMIKAFPNTYRQDEYIDLLATAAQFSGVEITTISTSVPSDPEGSSTGPAVVPDSIATQAPEDENAPPPGAIVADGGDTPAGGVPHESASRAIGQFPLAQIEVAMTLTGAPADVQRFLDALAGLSRPTIVDSISISMSGDNTSTAQISGRTYLSRPLEIPEILQQ